MERVIPALLALLLGSLAIPTSGAPIGGMTAGGAGTLSNCGALDVIVPANLSLAGQTTGTGWSIQAAAVPKDPCLVSTMANVFTSDGWDPTVGGCLGAPGGIETLCLDDPQHDGEAVRYEVTWCRPDVCARGAVDARFLPTTG